MTSPLSSDDRQELVDARLAMEDYLATLRLKMHPIKSQLFETLHGANFVGFRVLPDRIRVRNDNLRRARKRIQQLQRGLCSGQNPPQASGSTAAELGSAPLAWGYVSTAPQGV